MRHVSIVLLVAVVSVIWVVSAKRVVPPSTSKLVMGSSVEVDLGVIEVGASKKTKLSAFNSRSTSVKIVDVQTSCGCVEVIDCPAEIAACGAVDITIAVNPRAVGFQRSKVLILTNSKAADCNAFEASITSCGAGIKCSPSSIDFGDVHSGTQITQALSVVSFGVDSCKITSISGPDWLEIAPDSDGFIPTSTQHEQKHYFNLLTRSVPFGRIRGTLHIEGVRNNQPFRLEVPVTGHGVPERRCTPSQLLFVIPRDAIISLPQVMSIRGEVPRDINVSVDDPRVLWSMRPEDSEFSLNVWIDISSNGRRTPVSTILRGKSPSGDEIFNLRVVGVFKS